MPPRLALAHISARTLASVVQALADLKSQLVFGSLVQPIDNERHNARVTARTPWHSFSGIHDTHTRKDGCKTDHHGPLGPDAETARQVRRVAGRREADGAHPGTQKRRRSRRSRNAVGRRVRADDARRAGVPRPRRDRRRVASAGLRNRRRSARAPTLNHTLASASSAW